MLILVSFADIVILAATAAVWECLVWNQRCMKRCQTNTSLENHYLRDLGQKGNRNEGHAQDQHNRWTPTPHKADEETTCQLEVGGTILSFQVS